MYQIFVWSGGETDIHTHTCIRTNKGISPSSSTPHTDLKKTFSDIEECVYPIPGHYRFLIWSGDEQTHTDTQTYIRENKGKARTHASSGLD